MLVWVSWKFYAEHGELNCPVMINSKKALVDRLNQAENTKQGNLLERLLINFGSAWKEILHHDSVTRSLDPNGVCAPNLFIVMNSSSSKNNHNKVADVLWL